MLQVRCPQCGASLKAPPEAVGRKVKCRSCQTSFVVTAEAAPPVAAAEANPQPDIAASPAAVESVSVEAPNLPVAEPMANPNAFAVAPGSVSRVSRRRKKSGSGGLIIAAVVLLAVAGGGYWYWQYGMQEPAGPQAMAMKPQTIKELEEFRLRMAAQGSSQVPVVEIEEGPEGATVDSATGEFVWTPSEAQGPGEHTVILVARTAPDEPIRARAKVRLTVEEVPSPPVFDPVKPIFVNPDEPVTLTVVAKDVDVPTASVTYALPELDPKISAKLDKQTGVLTVTPNSDDSGRELIVVVEATELDTLKQTNRLPVRISVRSMESPIDRLSKLLAASGRKTDAAYVDTLDFQGDRHVLLFGNDQLHVFLYKTSDEAASDAQAFQQDVAKPAAAAASLAATTHFYRHENCVAAYAGDNSTLLAKLEGTLGKPFYEAAYVAPTVTAERDIGLDLLITLYKERDPRSKSPKLFSPFEYPRIRKVFAERFEKAHELELHQAFGYDKDYDEMLEWLNKRPDFKESLFLAFDPQYDDIAVGLGLVKALREKFPKQIDKYLSLAVATAVVWDRQNGVYDYTHHQQRVHATMPDGLLAALENFQYLVETEQVMEGRIRYVPWEFLIHVINHRTPAPERQWSLATMLPRRVMFGKCYSDVPYDNEMLATESRVCKLDGKEYSLPNILQFGGVCAMQADYAARVGKSLGVPAEYVGGASSYGENHAWVMWVELTAATPTNVGFTLQSSGRYRGDNYYVGHLADPQTGRRMSDRDLERRLQAVGTNAFAKRQADLVMQAYPQLREELRLSVDDQFEFLSQVTRLAPWNEAAWMEVAQLAEEKGQDKLGKKQMVAVLEQLFNTFAGLPDYSLVVFPELVKFESDPAQQIKYYYQLLEVYAAAKRPDLAFQGLYLLADLLVENQREQEAIQALAASAKKYAEEGQYVPKMLDKIEALCTTPQHKQALVAFYNEFLPLIPERRGNSPSKYCMQMYERGIRVFQENAAGAAAQAYQQKLQGLKSSGSAL